MWGVESDYKMCVVFLFTVINVLELVMRITHVCKYNKNSLSLCFERVNFMISKLYLSKATIEEKK